MTKRLIRLAAIVIVGITALAATPEAASADDPTVVVVAKDCRGSRVLRCLEIRYDWDDGRMRVWASATDNANDAENYSVAVTGVRLIHGQYNWYTPDNDGYLGYWDISDVAAGELVECISTYEGAGAHGYFSWINPAGQVSYETIDDLSGHVCF